MNNNKVRWLLCVVLVSGIGYGTRARTADGSDPADTGLGLDLRRVGLRLGTSVDDDKGRVNSYELVAEFALPWKRGLGRSWGLGTDFWATAGAMESGSDVTGVFSLGPGVQVFGFGRRLVLSGNVGVGLLTSSTLGQRELGGLFQFFGGAGVDLRMLEHGSVGLWFQHMSDFGIYGRGSDTINRFIVQLMYVY